MGINFPNFLTSEDDFSQVCWVKCFHKLTSLNYHNSNQVRLLLFSCELIFSHVIVRAKKANPRHGVSLKGHDTMSKLVCLSTFSASFQVTLQLRREPGGKEEKESGQEMPILCLDQSSL